MEGDNTKRNEMEESEEFLKELESGTKSKGRENELNLGKRVKFGGRV